MRFHINEDGNAKQCSASNGNCPFGEQSPHFDSKEEAEKHYENSMSTKTIKPVKKMKVYRVGTLTPPETYFESLESILQDMDKFKPEGRQGRYKGIFASPDLNSHARWVRGNQWNKHEGALDSHEITIDANSVYVYNVEDYEKASSIQNLYGAESEKFKEAAEKFWNSGMILSDWNEWSKENKPEKGTWEIIMPAEAMISSKKMSNRSIIENVADEYVASELNHLLEPKRAFKGLIWRKNILSEKIKQDIREHASQKLNKDFVNDMEKIYEKNAYKIGDVYSAQKEIYSAIHRLKKNRGESAKTFANLTKNEQKDFYNDVKAYIEIVDKIVDENKSLNE